MAVGSFPPCEFSSILTDQNSLFQSDQEIRLAEALVSVLQDAKSMHISVFTTYTNPKYHSSHLYTNNHLYHATENTANQNTETYIVHYYMAESHKDWELANSRI